MLIPIALGLGVVYLLANHRQRISTGAIDALSRPKFVVQAAPPQSVQRPTGTFAVPPYTVPPYKAPQQIPMSGRCIAASGCWFQNIKNGQTSAIPYGEVVQILGGYGDPKLSFVTYFRVLYQGAEGLVPTTALERFQS